MTERTSSPNSPSHPVGVGNAHRDRQSDRQDHRQEPQTTPRDRGGATDAGRTSGGGSSGHKAPDDVNEAAPIRNNPR
jgi:hypothetical protein